jgi:hypothetical protein
MISEEMVTLFARGCELQAAGKEDSAEYRALDKKLNISLLRKGWHEVSVLDATLDHRMPHYVKSLASGRDWHISVRERQALLEEPEHVRRGESAYRSKSRESAS